MAQISKRRMRKRDWDKVWGSLIEVMKKSNSKESVGWLLDGLLTRTERVMVAKRLMVALLTMCGWSAYEIAESLCLSAATVYKLRETLDLNPNFSKVLRGLVPADEVLERIKTNDVKEIGVLDELGSFIVDILSVRSDRSRTIYGEYPKGR